MTKKGLRDFLRNLIQPDSLINFAAIIVAIVLGYRSIETRTLDQYFQAVLAVLGVLAFAQLVSRFPSIQREEQMKRLVETVAKLESFMIGKVSVDMIFKNRSNLPSLQAVLENAKQQMDVVGTSLISLANQYYPLLELKRGTGCRIRLIVANPSNKLLNDMIVDRFPEAIDPETHGHIIRTTLKSVSKIAGHHSSGGSLEVRVLDCFPPFGMIIIDGDSPNGKMQVELYPDSCQGRNRPIFELSASHDSNWYRFFKEQFDILWCKGTEVRTDRETSQK